VHRVAVRTKACFPGEKRKFFFGDLVDKRTLVSLFDFENKGIFPAVDSRVKFSLLTVAGSSLPAVYGARFAFFLHNYDELRDPTHPCPVRARPSAAAAGSDASRRDTR